MGKRKMLLMASNPEGTVSLHLGAVLDNEPQEDVMFMTLIRNEEVVFDVDLSMNEALVIVGGLIKSLLHLTGLEIHEEISGDICPESLDKLQTICYYKGDKHGAKEDEDV